MNLERPEAEPSPYLLERPPTSHGRVLLACGFQFYCGIHWGMSGEDVAAAFGSGGDERDRTLVTAAAGLIGSVFARGTVGTWARPIGGGLPVELPASAWELDDFAQRFASSALDAGRPFDASAPPTHWIFLDADGWDRLIEASVADVAHRVAPALRRVPSTPRSAGEAIEPQPAGGEERLLRLPEVKRRTGLSRSTIYRKMDQGTFPRSIAVSENIAAWRQCEVAAWIDGPR